VFQDAASSGREGVSAQLLAWLIGRALGSDALSVGLCVRNLVRMSSVRHAR
jgi:hypothetical protein